MRYAAMVGVGLLVAVGAGSAPGWASGFRRTSLAKEADAWLYPKAKVVSSAESGGRIFQAVLTADDGFGVVLKHYDAKCGTSLADEPTSPGAFDSRSEVAEGVVKSTLAVDDSTVPVPTRAKGTPRGVLLRQVTRDE